jgi:hypothetical protein
MATVTRGDQQMFSAALADVTVGDQWRLVVLQKRDGDPHVAGVVSPRPSGALLWTHSGVEPLPTAVAFIADVCVRDVEGRLHAALQKLPASHHAFLCAAAPDLDWGADFADAVRAWRAAQGPEVQDERDGTGALTERAQVARLRRLVEDQARELRALRAATRGGQ